MKTIKEFMDFVQHKSWIFAKTYADRAPHEYIVKDKLSEDDKVFFEEAVLYIRENGFPAFFGGYEHIYLYADGHYYWTMGDPVEETIILNRCKYKDYHSCRNDGFYRY